jgi:hypothetical protein
LICAQQVTYLGDLIFENNQDKKVLISDAFYTRVEIGYLFSNAQKHAVIFQQIDSLKYINELKLITYHESGITEKLIDQFEIGMFSNWQRKDMNNDGYRDIIITQGGNRYWDMLYLYDPQNDSLHRIPEFFDYPDTEQIGDTGYFYSYLARGCADAEWESKLIRIEEQKIVEYGSIYGHGCHQAEDKRMISIKHGDIAKELSMDKTLGTGNDKWKFIKEYWERIIIQDK